MYTKKFLVFDKNTIFIILILLFWLFAPFLTIFLVLLLFCKRLSICQYKCMFLVISMSFALLAYTQKSLFYLDTDIIRYYNAYYPFIDQSFDLFSLMFVLENNLTFSFNLINVLLVCTFANVQIISIFGVFCIYYFYFLSLLKLFEHEGISISPINILLVTFISIFGFILFTQVTDTIKNAASFAIFFYAFICFICNENKLKIILLYIIGVGIHSSILMLLPLFLYKKINTQILILLFILAVLISSRINIMSLFSIILPDVGFGSLLLKKAETYSIVGDAQSSIRYIGISCVMLLSAIYLSINKLFNVSNKYMNIIFIYLIIMYLNYNNPDGYIRFANFAHFLFLFEFIQLLRDKKRYSLVIFLFIVVFIVTNFQMTYSRTLSGGYCSSYMNNSIFQILFSNVVEYLSFKAY